MATDEQIGGEIFPILSLNPPGMLKVYTE